MKKGKNRAQMCFVPGKVSNREHRCVSYLEHFLQHTRHVEAEVGAERQHAVEEQHQKAVATCNQ